jgi:tRNA modification GTPase
MLPRHHDPIVAVATAPGRAAVGIVRASGRDLRPLIDAICRQTLVPRRATHLVFADARGEPIDQGLAIHFQSPHSYTGEDVLELQAHGGPVVLQLLLARCLEAARETDPRTGEPRLRGLRVAEPGEFTERAFLNDKLDLAQAEAVSDLIDSSTEAAARSATRSLQGAFSREIERVSEALVKLRTLVEATLDFPDEEIDFLDRADARGQLKAIGERIVSVLERARQGALLREGISVVLAGQPNVGKSSLLNALAGAELAIVTPIPGTTRDKVSQTVQIEGVPLHVIDTAGLRESAAVADEVESIGIARSWAEIERADAVLFLHDLTREGEPHYDAGEAHIAARLQQLSTPHARLLHIHNKADLVAPPPGVFALSARTGLGIDALRRRLLELAGWHADVAGTEGVFIARARHVYALQETQAHLACAQALARDSEPALDLLAEELRLAHNALGLITGTFTSDDLLGQIFSRFCIGK